MPVARLAVSPGLGNPVLVLFRMPLLHLGLGFSLLPYLRFIRGPGQRAGQGVQLAS